MGQSKLENDLAGQLDMLAKSEGRWPFPAPVRQYHPWWCCQHTLARHTMMIPPTGGVGARRWCKACDGWCPLQTRFDRPRHSVDFAWPRYMLAVECEGIKYGGEAGRHQRGTGFEADAAKYARLELEGWRVVRVTQRLITSGVALSLIEQGLRKAMEA